MSLLGYIGWPPTITVLSWAPAASGTARKAARAVPAIRTRALLDLLRMAVLLVVVCVLHIRNKHRNWIQKIFFKMFESSSFSPAYMDCKHLRLTMKTGGET
jgi:hypothetical protein